MVAGVLAVDLIKGCFAFTPKQAFNINSSSGDEEFTERYFDDLIVKIENELQGDIGQAVIIAPTSLSANLRDYFMQKFEDIGIMSKNFIRFETLFVIGALADTKITIAKNETVAVFYYHELKLIGDQWKKTEDKLIFEKRIFCSKNENGLNKVFSKVPNHILISDKIIKPEKHFPQMKFQIFNEDGDTFLLSAALTKARILMKEAALKGFDAKDIGNMQISTIGTKVINVIGISIGSDTFSIVKYANDKIGIIKNAENEDTSKCTVFWKNGQIFLNGNQEGSHKLEYCFDLLGLQSIESREPFTQLNLAEIEDAPNTKVCYNIHGKIVNPERAALELLKHIRAISGATKDTKIIFSLSTEIKNDPKKCQLFLRLTKEAGFEDSEIVENTLALCLGGSQNRNKKENGTFIGINVSETKIDASLYRLANNQIYDFKEASKNFPPRQTPGEFVALLREHLLIIAKTAFDVMKLLNIERTDIDCVLLNYTGKFKETTKEFLQRMFLEKQIIELQPSNTLTAIGAAIYGGI